MAIIGGVYKEKGSDEYAVSDGKHLFWLFDGIDHIESDVDLNIPSSIEHVDGYSLHIDKAKKTWSIRDTGHKNCKHILQSGSYEEGFEKSLKSLLGMFNKTI